MPKQTSNPPSPPAASPFTKSHANYMTRFLLMMATGLAFMLLVAGFAEVAARQFYYESLETTSSCLILDKATHVISAKPNTICRQKVFESPLTEYRFNECGHRTSSPCHPSPGHNERRIVLIGSSMVEGMWVPEDATFASRLPEEINGLTNQKIDIYNEGMQWGTARSVASRLDEILAAEPNLVMWPITPFDIETDGEDLEPREQAGKPGGFLERVTISYRKHNGISGLLSAAFDRALEPLRQSRVAFLMQHFMYQDQDQYIRHLIMDPRKYDNLSAKGSVNSRGALALFEKHYAVVSEKLRAAGIPLLVLLLPNHAQVSLLSGASAEFPDLDADLLNREVRTIAEQHRDTYIDIFDYFRSVDRPERDFYPVDEHMTVEGHASVAKFLAEKLNSTPVFLRIIGKPITLEK